MNNCKCSTCSGPNSLLHGGKPTHQVNVGTAEAPQWECAYLIQYCDKTCSAVWLLPNKITIAGKEWYHGLKVKLPWDSAHVGNPPCPPPAP